MIFHRYMAGSTTIHAVFLLLANPGIYILCPTIYEQLPLVLCALPVALLLLASAAMACVLTMLCVCATIFLVIAIARTMHVLEIVSVSHCLYSSGGVCDQYAAGCWHQSI